MSNKPVLYEIGKLDSLHCLPSAKLPSRYQTQRTSKATRLSRSKSDSPGVSCDIQWLYLSNSQLCSTKCNSHGRYVQNGYRGLIASSPAFCVSARFGTEDGLSCSLRGPLHLHLYTSGSMPGVDLKQRAEDADICPPPNARHRAPQHLCDPEKAKEHNLVERSQERLCHESSSCVELWEVSNTLS